MGITQREESLTVTIDDGNQTINGVKTFTSFPILPATDPVSDNQATPKQYVDDEIQRPKNAGIADIAPPAFTDNGNGTGTFAACNVAVYDNEYFVGIPKQIAVAEKTLSFTDNSEEYVCIRYIGGLAEYYKETIVANITDSNIVLVYVVWRQGTILHSADQDSCGLGLANKMNSMMLNTMPYRMAINDELILTETNVPVARTVLCSDAVVYKGSIPALVDVFNSSTDLLTKAVHTAGGWVYSTTAQYDNVSYNPNASGEVAMQNDNKWCYRLFYRSVGDIKEIFYVEGTAEYNNIDDARIGSETGRTDLPILLLNHCILVGRALIKKNAVSGVIEPFIRHTGAFTTFIPQHNSLLGLQGGTTNEEYHLTLAEHTSLLASKFGDANNYSQFGTNGKLTMYGDATVYDDISFPMTQAKKGSSDKPDFDYTNIGLLFPRNDLTEKIYIIAQMSHSKKMNTPVYLHIHYIQNSVNKPVFRCEYRKYNNGETPPAYTTINTNDVGGNQGIFTYTSGDMLQIADFPDIAIASGETVSMNFDFIIYRTDNVMVGDCLVKFVDLHYEKDSIGSDQEYIK
jgi:hypothetical protein